MATGSLEHHMVDDHLEMARVMQTTNTKIGIQNFRPRNPLFNL
jgi:hypothetical protein